MASTQDRHSSSRHRSAALNSRRSPCPTASSCRPSARPRTTSRCSGRLPGCSCQRTRSSATCIRTTAPPRGPADRRSPGCGRTERCRCGRRPRACSAAPYGPAAWRPAPRDRCRPWARTRCAGSRRCRYSPRSIVLSSSRSGCSGTRLRGLYNPSSPTARSRGTLRRERCIAARGKPRNPWTACPTPRR